MMHLLCRVRVLLIVAALLLNVATPTQAGTAAQEYEQLISVLASPQMEGRGAGTRGLELARDYLVQQFRAAGLLPAFFNAASYTQPFEVTLAPKVEHLALSLHGHEAAPSQVAAIGFSGSGEFNAPIVFVGYGIRSAEHGYDSYAGLSDEALRGKVALAFRYEPMDGEGQSQWNKQSGRWSAEAALTHKAEAAAKRGAVALLVVNPPGAKGAGLVQTARTSGAATADIPLLHVDADWLRQAAPQLDLAALQREVDRQPATAALDLAVRGSVKLVRPAVTVDNVGGFIPGAGQLAEQVVVLGAHYDHLGYGEFGSLYQGDEPMIHHGADDNASGTAAIVLAARQLAQPSTEPRRSILIVAFTAEERGLLGATHLLNHIEDTGLRLEQIVAMVNLDMVGRMKDGVLNVMGAGSGAGLNDLIHEAANGIDVKLKLQEIAPGGSDHVAFQIKGVPAVHLFTGSHGDYHRPSDTADKINAAGGALVADYTQRLVQRLATQPQAPAFVAQEAFAHHGGPGGPQGGAVLGVMPDYASLEGDAGAIITGVMPGSPAERAGLQSGDVIIAWDGKKVGNVRELTDLLGESKGGQKVTMTVRRGEQVVELVATLGAR